MSRKLGWLLSGPCPKSSTGDRTLNNLILAGECVDNSRVQTDRDDELVNVLKQFWETENIGIKSIEFEKPNEKEFLPDIRFTGERYEVRLPWKGEPLAIDDDYDLCHNRLRLLHHKLRKQPDLMAEYDKRIEEQLATGMYVLYVCMYLISLETLSSSAIRLVFMRGVYLAIYKYIKTKKKLINPQTQREY